MQLNQAGIDLIKSFESLRLTAYHDMVGVLTIGYGETKNVTPGQVITADEAEAMLSARLKEFSAGVAKLLTVTLSDNAFSALVSFAYNLGLGSLRSSNLLTKINSGRASEAADEFLKWNHANGQVVAGLTRRRQAERALYLKAQA